jgi:hypothetical protein
MKKLHQLRSLSLLLLLICLDLMAGAQPIHIKGKVIDKNGQPVPYAAIKLDKKGNLIFAGEKGEFEIQSDSGSTIRIACGGYEEQEIQIRNQDSLLIILELSYGIEGLESSSATIIQPGVLAKRMDSLYANDIIIQRDKVLPDSLNGFSLYPSTMASGGIVTLGIQLLESGNYEYRIVDNSGKQITSREISLDSISKVISLTMPLLEAGSYRFLLVNKSNGKSFMQLIRII